MKRVTGIGGVFIRAKDQATLTAWYKKHLGIDVQPWGGTTFQWDEPKQKNGCTVWSVFPAKTSYFKPSKSRFMINYRVENLARLRKQLIKEGCDVDEKSESTEFGKFGWVMDPEGNRIELWEPPKGKFPG